MVVLTARNLSGIDSLAHGFFGRTGGVSEGIFASLNCGPGSGDAPENVLENRRLVVDALAGGRPARLLTLYQIHSATAFCVRESWEVGSAPRADAMVTNIPGLALGILTADCTPVLLADAEAGLVGAAHAGWKGALGGVIESAVAAMVQMGGRRARIRAAIGPAIGQAHYEVGPEFLARLVDDDGANARFFAEGARPAHWQFDLPGYVAHRLRTAGVGNIETLGRCTYANEGDFFSFRRATHRGETDYGRQVSAILLER